MLLGLNLGGALVLLLTFLAGRWWGQHHPKAT